MTTLVTGASGFVGSHLRQKLPCYALELDGSQVDIRDADRIRAALRAQLPEAVVHLAAQSAVPASFKNPGETLNINIFGTLNILQALDEANFRGVLLYVGSGQVYGTVKEKDLPITEELLPRPANPYAVSKLAAEALCVQWSRSSRYRIVLARPFNHIGPGQSRAFVVSDFAAQVTEIKLHLRDAVMQVGDLSVTRDLTDVADVVEAYVQLLKHGKHGEVYNICTGREYAIEAVLRRLIELAGITARIEKKADRTRPSDQPRLVASYAKLQAETGWTPHRTLDDSLIDILNYWERTLNA